MLSMLGIMWWEINLFGIVISSIPVILKESLICRAIPIASLVMKIAMMAVIFTLCYLEGGATFSSTEVLKQG